MTSKQTVRQRDFSGGELVAYAKRRDDEPAVRSGARALKNLRILSTGAVDQRPGRAALFANTGRVDEVRVDALTTVFLCFGDDGSLTIRDDEGMPLAQAFGYAWTADTAPQAVWALFNRDIIITFPDQVPKLVRWDGEDGWLFLDWEATETEAGRRLTPFVRMARPGITMALSALTGSITVTFSDNVLQPGHVGVRFRYYDRQVEITSVTSATSGTADVVEILRVIDSLDFSTVITEQFGVGDIVEGATTGSRGYVAEVGTPGTDDITRIRLNAIVPTIGEVIVGPQGQASYQTLNTAPTAGPAITVWDEELMNDYRGWPRSVTVDQNRLIFCDFPGLPEAVAWSANGDMFDFQSGTADDADPTDAIVEFAPKKARVLHITEGADEFVFTDLGLYYIPISESNPLRPGSVAFRAIPGAPASSVRPISTAQGVVYVNNARNRVLGLIGTGQTAMPYLVRPASDLQSHLFEDVTCLAVEQGGSVPPDEFVYAVNGDGSVVVGRYQVGKDWAGWLPWNGEGAVNWISVAASAAVFSTEYSSGWVIERLDADLYLDAAVSYDAIPAAFATGAQADILVHEDQGSLIGTMTAGGGLAAAFDGVTALTSISLITSATSAAVGTTPGFALPSGIQTGDLLVWWNKAAAGGPVTAVLPSGFTQIVTFAESETRCLAAYKLALGNESGTVVNGMTGTDNSMLLYVFRASAPLTAVEVGDIASEGNDADPTAQVVNASGLAGPLIVFGGYGTINTPIDPRDFSPAKDGEINASTSGYLAYKIYNSAPANVTIDMADEGNSNMLASWYIQVAASSSQLSASTTGAVGKTFGQRFKLAKAEVWPSTLGFTDQANVTISLRAKQDGAPIDYAVDGTQLATTGSIADTSSMQTLTSNDETTAWDHAWVLITIASGVSYVAEVIFYAPGATHGSGELWFLDTTTLYVMDGVRYLGARETDANGEVVLEPGDAFTDETFGHLFGEVIIEPFTPHVAPGQTIGQTMTRRQIGNGAIAVQNSVGFRIEKYNWQTEAWVVVHTRAPYDSGDDEEAAPPLREEAVRWNALGVEIDPRVRIIRDDYPGPLRVLEIDFEIEA